MDLDELRSVRRTERESSTLQHLRDSFYRDVADYIESRKDDYRERMTEADDPFAASEEVEHVKDEIETAEDVAEAIYERRVGKVVKMAAFAAADMSTDEEGLTVEERRLFEDLVDRIRENRESVLATLSGASAGTGSGSGSGAGGDESDGDGEGERADRSAEPAEPTGPAGVDADVDADADADAGAGPDAGPDDPPERAAGADAGAGAAPTGAATEADAFLSEAMGAGAPPGDAADVDDAPDGRKPAPTEDPHPDPDPDPGSAGAAGDGGSGVGGQSTAEEGVDSDSGSEPDRTTVWLRRDVGRILGVDEREYDLASEDVVDLPTTNAEPLIERGAAERLE